MGNAAVRDPSKFRSHSSLPPSSGNQRGGGDTADTPPMASCFVRDPSLSQKYKSKDPDPNAAPLPSMDCFVRNPKKQASYRKARVRDPAKLSEYRLQATNAPAVVPEPPDSRAAPMFARVRDPKLLSAYREQGSAHASSSPPDGSRNDAAHQHQVQQLDELLGGAYRSSSASQWSSLPTVSESSLAVRVQADGFQFTPVRTREAIFAELAELTTVYEAGFIGAAEFERRHAPLVTELEQALSANSSDSGAQHDDKSRLKSGGEAQVEIASDATAEEGEDGGPRAVRLFLSSTFLDMSEERTQLIKYCFPQIRRLCAELGVDFMEVDLRWGITAEQAQSGESLDLCLSAVDRCRPYFIGMVGDRYGRVHKKIPPHLLQKFPFLRDCTGKSITEMEIRYGAINDPSQRALMFIRDRKGRPPLDGEGDDPENTRKLKQLISSSKLRVTTYQNAEQLPQFVISQLGEQIRKDFPKTVVKDPFEQAQSNQASFLRTFTGLYLRRSALFEELDRFVAQRGSCGPLLIQGESGVGKSALLANWLRARSPPQVLVHFSTCSPEDALLSSFQRRVVHRLQTLRRLEDPIATDAKCLYRDCKRLLANGLPDKSAAPLLIVLDGLNLFTDVKSVDWLPERLGPNIHLMLSCSASSALSSMVEKYFSATNLQRVTIPDLQASDRLKLAGVYLAAFNKSFTEAQMNRVVTAPRAGTPLFLLALLEELRVQATFESVDEMIERLRLAPTTSSLFERVLQRWEQDVVERAPELVRDALSLLCLSKSGLSESELFHMLNHPRAEVWKFLQSMREYLIDRAGLLSFRYDHLRQAVTARYLNAEDLQQSVHRRLADYFVSTQFAGSLARKCETLPFHLLASNSFYLLKCVLTEPEVFLHLHRSQRRHQLKYYWQRIKDHVTNSSTAATDQYVSVLLQPDDGAVSSSSTVPSSQFALFQKVGSFLRSLEEYEGAGRFLEVALELAKRAYPNSTELAKSYYLVAQLNWNQGRWAEAEAHVIPAMELYTTLLGENDLEVARCLCGLGEIKLYSDPDQARPLLEKALRIRRALLGNDHALVSRILHDLALIHDQFGEHRAAVTLHLQAIDIRKRVLGDRHPQLAVSWENLGSTYQIMGASQQAEHAMKMALELNLEAHGRIAAATASCHHWLALILADLGKYVESDSHKAESEFIQQALQRRGVFVTERIID